MKKKSTSCVTFGMVNFDVFLPILVSRTAQFVTCGYFGCAATTKQVPPLRLLDGRDMLSRKMQKRLSQLRYLMQKIENDAASKNMLQLCQSIEDATQVFGECADSVAVNDVTERSRKRRRGQLSWATVGKLVRKQAKTKQLVSVAAE